MMKYAVIQRPSQSVVEILRRKMTDSEIKKTLEAGRVESVGICQGAVLEILVACDIAEKTAGVVVGEVNGSCPQHITCLAMLGDTGAVKAAMDAIREAMQTAELK